ncbi:hypothetical protein STVA_24060 [Allostella vacuolata]|nr:hypothetical protein STVA_24060 [Stella vacuolata]
MAEDDLGRELAAVSILLTAPGLVGFRADGQGLTRATKAKVGKHEPPPPPPAPPRI